MTNNRLSHVIQFYDMLDILEKRYGGKRTLSQCTGRQVWPERGVYFFFEPGEERTTSGTGDRVVRIGTHALKLDGKTMLWNRLSQHRGKEDLDNGNHRGSIFRKLVGQALINHDPSIKSQTWGKSSPKTPELQEEERKLEAQVSQYLGQMQILWLNIPDAPSPNSQRGTIERNTISLLSNWKRSGDAMIDPPSFNWLGRLSSRPKVRGSGLWNQQHVDEPYDPAFLNVFSELMRL